MKTLTLTLLSIGIFALFMNYNTSSAQVDDLTQLKAINARFIHNYVTNDVKSHDEIIHPDFWYINSKGKWVNRKDYLENWKTGFDPEKIIYWDYRFERITIVGAAALVRSVNKYVILTDGKEVSGMDQYTDTYVKEGGKWRCLQAQITQVAPENYPGDETIVKKYVKGKIQ